MSYRLRILRRAERDVQAIYDYIAVRSSAGAARWWEGFETAAAVSAKHPLACGLAPEAHNTEHEVRQFLFRTRRGRTYRGLFTIVGDEVRVLRVRGPGQPALDVDELKPND